MELVLVHGQHALDRRSRGRGSRHDRRHRHHGRFRERPGRRRPRRRRRQGAARGQSAGRRQRAPRGRDAGRGPAAARGRNRPGRRGRQVRARRRCRSSRGPPVAQAAGWQACEDRGRDRQHRREYRHRRHGRDGPTAPPEAFWQASGEAEPPCPRPGAGLRKPVVAEGPGPVRHADPVRSAGGRVVRAGAEHLPGKARRQRRLGRGAGLRLGRTAHQGPAEALVAGDRLQPGIELGRVAEPVDAGPGDDERVPYRFGGDRGFHRVAVVIQCGRVPVQDRSEPVQFARRDRRDDCWVVHAPTVIPRLRTGPP